MSDGYLAEAVPSIVRQQPLARRLPAAAQIAIIAIALLLALLQGALWYRSIELRGGPDSYARLVDLAATLTGAQVIRDGHGADLYDLAVQRTTQERVLAPLVTLKADTLLPYIHPPFEALLFAPLLGLPYGLLYLLWSGLVVAATLAALFLLSRATLLAPPARWVALAAFCSFSPLYQAFWLGQSSPLVLLGLCGAYAGSKRGHEGWAGVSLALLVLKPQMLLVVGLLMLAQRRWKMLAACAAIVGGLSVAAMPILGPAWPLRYARFLSGIGGWQGNHNEYPQIMYNWRGLLTNLLGPVAPAMIAPALVALTVAALAVLFWAWRRLRPRSATDSWGREHELLWALVVPIAVLVAPHLYIHDLALLILPAWIVVARLSAMGEQRRTRIWLTLLWLGYALTLASLFRAEDVPAFPTVPGVLLIAAMAGLLIQEIGTQAARPPRVFGSVTRADVVGAVPAGQAYVGHA